MQYRYNCKIIEQDWREIILKKLSSITLNDSEIPINNQSWLCNINEWTYLIVQPKSVVNFSNDFVTDFNAFLNVTYVSFMQPMALRLTRIFDQYEYNFIENNQVLHLFGPRQIESGGKINSSTWLIVKISTVSVSDTFYYKIGEFNSSPSRIWNSKLIDIIAIITLVRDPLFSMHILPSCLLQNAYLISIYWSILDMGTRSH